MKSIVDYLNTYDFLFIFLIFIMFSMFAIQLFFIEGTYYSFNDFSEQDSEQDNSCIIV